MYAVLAAKSWIYQNKLTLNLHIDSKTIRFYN
jgi:hypothetical protein